MSGLVKCLAGLCRLGCSRVRFRPGRNHSNRQLVAAGAPHDQYHGGMGRLGSGGFRRETDDGGRQNAVGKNRQGQYDLPVSGSRDISWGVPAPSRLVALRLWEMPFLSPSAEAATRPFGTKRTG